MELNSAYHTYIWVPLNAVLVCLQFFLQPSVWGTFLLHLFSSQGELISGSAACSQITGTVWQCTTWYDILAFLNQLFNDHDFQDMLPNPKNILSPWNSHKSEKKYSRKGALLLCVRGWWCRAKQYLLMSLFGFGIIKIEQSFHTGSINWIDWFYHQLDSHSITLE